MFRLLHRRPARTRTPLYRKLQLESLDGRIVPAAATITNLGGCIIGTSIIVHGTVHDDNPALDTVTASGGITGSQTTTGEFEFIAPYTGNGTVNLVVRDDEGFTSQTYTISLSTSSSNQAPYVTFTVSYGTGRSITLTGTVYDESPMSTIVAVSGVATANNIRPDMSGNFSVTVTATGLGTVYAQATDMFALKSNLAARTLTTNKPVIESFSVDTIGLDYYRLSGRVVDESAQGLIVRFGGEIDALANVTATVGADGWFEVTVNLTNSKQSGWVTADVTDWWGVAADQVTDYMSP